MYRARNFDVTSGKANGHSEEGSSEKSALLPRVTSHHTYFLLVKSNDAFTAL